MQPTPAVPDPLPAVDGNELRAVKDALDVDPTDAGLGVLDVLVNRIYLL